MAALADILRAPELERLRPVAGPVAGGEPASVVVVEDLAEIGGAERDAILILTRAASRDALGYRLDVALREATERRVRALVLTEPAGRLPATAAAIADKGGVCVLEALELPIATLVTVITREIAGGAEPALARAGAALDVVERAERRVEVDELLTAVAAATGTPLTRGEPSIEELSASVTCDGQQEEAPIRAPRQGGHADTATKLVLRLTADAVARTVAAARRAEEAPAISRVELLTEFLASDEASAGRLVDRARALGLPIDGWHLVVRLESDQLPAEGSESELSTFEHRDTLASLAVSTARAGGGIWHWARAGFGLLLIHTDRDDPGPMAPVQLRRTIARMLSRMKEHEPGLVLRCGVGGVHAHAYGMRVSATEAQAAVAAARVGDLADEPVLFDAVGLRRTLIEWYASDTAREAVRGVLAPLDRLGPTKAETAVRTLRSWLDHQGSLSKVAEELHLHRNAVAYRVRRIFERLDVDPDDPDTRLLLQLACRARTMR